MSLGSQQSSSESSQTRGLSPYYQNWFSAETPKEYENVRSLAREAQADPAGLAYQDTVNRLLPVGQYGFHPSTEMGTLQLGRDLFSNASGSRASRGFTNPLNLEGVVGDAIRMAAPGLIQYQQQYALDRAKMLQELQKLAFGYGTAPIQTITNLLSTTGGGTSSSSGFGLGFGIGGGSSSGGSSAPSAMGYTA